MAKGAIVYVGETRLDKTGLGYRSVLTRWGYGGGDHGGQARGIIKKTLSTNEVKTKVDPYLAKFDFDSGEAYILLTKGNERNMIKKMKDMSNKPNADFIVVNK